MQALFGNSPSPAMAKKGFGLGASGPGLGLGHGLGGSLSDSVRLGGTGRDSPDFELNICNSVSGFVSREKSPESDFLRAGGRPTMCASLTNLDMLSGRLSSPSPRRAADEKWHTSKSKARSSLSIGSMSPTLHRTSWSTRDSPVREVGGWPRDTPTKDHSTKDGYRWSSPTRDNDRWSSPGRDSDRWSSPGRDSDRLSSPTRDTDDLSSPTRDSDRSSPSRYKENWSSLLRDTDKWPSARLGSNRWSSPTRVTKESSDRASSPARDKENRPSLTQDKGSWLSAPRESERWSSSARDRDSGKDKQSKSSAFRESLSPLLTRRDTTSPGRWSSPSRDSPSAASLVRGVTSESPPKSGSGAAWPSQLPENSTDTSSDAKHTNRWVKVTGESMHCLNPRIVIGAFCTHSQDSVYKHYSHMI